MSVCECTNVWRTIPKLKKKRIVRSSRSQMFFSIDLLKGFAHFTGKHLCWSLFLIKFQASRPAAQVFSCEISKIFKKTFFTEHLRWLLLNSNVEEVIDLLKTSEE